MLNQYFIENVVNDSRIPESLSKKVASRRAHSTTCSIYNLNYAVAVTRAAFFAENLIRAKVEKLDYLANIFMYEINI